MKIIVDAMGGDYAPKEQVLGAVRAAKELDVDIILCGREEDIKRELELSGENTDRIQIHNCTEVVENEDDPIRGVRRKKDSSLVVGMKLLHEGKADAIVTSGNTGAVIAAAVFELGRIKGISRPAIAPMIPTMPGKPLLLLDSGANAICTPDNLLGFAIMGSHYMENILGIENPKVGLVNIGVEEKKGTPLTKETYQILKTADINFAGNLEARQIPHGDVDVAVTDGFTGNVILKLMEGMGEFMKSALKGILMKNTITKLSALTMTGGLKEFKKKFDVKEHGGAPLLGVDGMVVKAHGNSDAKAFCAAIRQAKKAVETDLLNKIKTAVEGSGLKDGADEDL